MGLRIKPALLTTSSRNDVKRSGGKIAITGLREFSLQDLISLEHRISRSEVSQVYTIGGTTPTITASTQYIIEIGFLYFDDGSGRQNSLQRFAYTTPATLSGNAATDRQNVYDALTAKINATNGGSLFVTANAGSGGTGMTLTDKAGYFAARPAAQRGPSVVVLPKDPVTGGGFVQATHLVLTTAGVVAFGVGTRMAQGAPIFDNITGNLSSGEFDGATTAVAGQLYDAFFVSSFKRSSWSIVIGEKALAVENQVVFVDNGTGTSTTNATGFAAILREMERIIYIDIYGKDSSSLVSLIEHNPLYGQKALANGTRTTGLPTGATGDENTMYIPDHAGGASFEYHVLGAGQTILTPQWTTSGLLITQDAADDEGTEIAASVESLCPHQYVVGQQECSFTFELTAGDITDLNPFAAGFRKKEAFQADYNDYDELAAFAIEDAAGATKVISLVSILNGNATVTDDTTFSMSEALVRFEIRVDLDGVVTFFINNVEYTDAQTTAFSFDAGEVIIPFIYHLVEGAADPALRLNKFLSIPAILKK